MSRRTWWGRGAKWCPRADCNTPKTSEPGQTAACHFPICISHFPSVSFMCVLVSVSLKISEWHCERGTKERKCPAKPRGWADTDLCLLDPILPKLHLKKAAPTSLTTKLHQVLRWVCTASAGYTVTENKLEFKQLQVLKFNTDRNNKRGP